VNADLPLIAYDCNVSSNESTDFTNANEVYLSRVYDSFCKFDDASGNSDGPTKYVVDNEDNEDSRACKSNPIHSNDFDDCH
jgi:hypothetical protein